jgi:hypothetical protein
MNAGIVAEALETLSWSKLRTQCEREMLDQASLQELLGYVRRSETLVLRRPDPLRAAKRDNLLRSLESFAEERLGDVAANTVAAEAALLRQVEKVYQGILSALSQSDVGGLDPAVRVAGVVWRMAREYKGLIAIRDRELKRRGHLSHTFMLRDSSGRSFNPDGTLTAMVEVVGMTLKMEAYRNQWFDESGRLVLPAFPSVDDQAVERAGVTAFLAMCWRRWARTEERRRYLGGAFVVYSQDELPDWAPRGATQVIDYRPESGAEKWDYIANERLNERLAQTYFEMLIDGSLAQADRGINDPLPLPPGHFVSGQEAHAAVSLSEIVAYNITDDQDRPGGLRLIEWLRGYATLQAIAATGKDQLILLLSRKEIRTILERVGLAPASAELFVDLATMKRSSWDLFDQPLVLSNDGPILLYGPAVLQANLARVVLSAIANLGVQLERKGTGFERDMRSFLSKQPGLKVYSFKANRGGEEFEYDAVVLWGDYLFLFECKNRSLSGHNPGQAYYFELETRSHVKQVERLVGALTRYPDILVEKIGPHAATKTIIPCVVNSLPFSVPKGINGIYFTDASALRRFFENRYFRAIAAYNLPKMARLLHRTALKSLWAGDAPTPNDLLHQLDDPFQVDLMIRHMELRPTLFEVNEGVVVRTLDYARREATVESVAAAVGASIPWVRGEKRKVEGAVRKLRQKADDDLVRQQVRSWRKRNLPDKDDA